MNMNACKSLYSILFLTSSSFLTTLAWNASLTWNFPKTSALTDCLALWAYWICYWFLRGESGSFISSRNSSSTSESSELSPSPPFFLPSSESEEDLSFLAILFFLITLALVLSFSTSSLSKFNSDFSSFVKGGVPFPWRSYKCWTMCGIGSWGFWRRSSATILVRMSWT